MSDDDAWHGRRRTLWERDAGLCGFCGDPVDLLEMDLDHIIPKADGGSNDDSNLRGLIDSAPAGWRSYIIDVSAIFPADETHEQG